jgi:hypothetical protein
MHPFFKQFDSYSERRKKWKSVDEMVAEYREAFEEWSAKPVLCKVTDFEGGFDNQVEICRKLIKTYFKDKRVNTYSPRSEAIVQYFRELSDSNLHEFSCIAAFALEGFKYKQDFQNSRLKLKFNITRKDYSLFIDACCKKSNDEWRLKQEKGGLK